VSEALLQPANGTKIKTTSKARFSTCPLVSLFFIGAVLSAAQTTLSASDPDIVTDRPDITESSIVVPRGSLQVENGWTLDAKVRLAPELRQTVKTLVTVR
jgi:hypothetical protein